MMCGCDALDAERDDAGTADGADRGIAGRTNGSAIPREGVDHPRPPRRSHSASSRDAPDHRAVAGVNPDASRSCGARGSGGRARHGRSAHGGWPGSVRRRRAGDAAGRAGRSHRRSRSGRGRTCCRSAPDRGTPRRRTAAPSRIRAARSCQPLVDVRHDCRDIGPACVPSTVWGTASSVTAKFRSAPCLPLDRGPLLSADTHGCQPDLRTPSVLKPEPKATASRQRLPLPLPLPKTRHRRLCADPDRRQQR
jgi:hypothetical protein